MTDTKRMTAEEAVKTLDDVIHNEAQIGLAHQCGPTTAKEKIDSWFAALAVLTGLAEENERLRAFYGNPENISVVADQLHVEVLEKENAALKARNNDLEAMLDCGAGTMVQAVVRERDALKVEVERLRGEITKTAQAALRIEKSRDDWAIRAEKAEAALDAARKHDEKDAEFYAKLERIKFKEDAAMLDECEKTMAGATEPRFPPGVHDVDEDVPSPGLSVEDHQTVHCENVEDERLKANPIVLSAKAVDGFPTKCPVCDGHGRVASPWIDRTRTTGIYDEEKPCHGCGGQGWILTKEKSRG
jgi:hypothetical protein